VPPCTLAARSEDIPATGDHTYSHSAAHTSDGALLMHKIDASQNTLWCSEFSNASTAVGDAFHDSPLESGKISSVCQGEKQDEDTVDRIFAFDEELVGSVQDFMEAGDCNSIMDDIMFEDIFFMEK